jgi:hypothetical protein
MTNQVSHMLSTMGTLTVSYISHGLCKLLSYVKQKMYTEVNYYSVFTPNKILATVLKLMPIILCSVVLLSLRQEENIRLSGAPDFHFWHTEFK